MLRSDSSGFRRLERCPSRTDGPAGLRRGPVQQPTPLSTVPCGSPLAYLLLRRRRRREPEAHRSRPRTINRAGTEECGRAESRCPVRPSTLPRCRFSPLHIIPCLSSESAAYMPALEPEPDIVRSLRPRTGSRKWLARAVHSSMRVCTGNGACRCSGGILGGVGVARREEVPTYLETTSCRPAWIRDHNLTTNRV